MLFYVIKVPNSIFLSFCSSNYIISIKYGTHGRMKFQKRGISAGKLIWAIKQRIFLFVTSFLNYYHSINKLAWWYERNLPSSLLKKLTFASWNTFINMDHGEFPPTTISGWNEWSIRISEDEKFQVWSKPKNKCPKIWENRKNIFPQFFQIQRK